MNSVQKSSQRSSARMFLALAACLMTPSLPAADWHVKANANNNVDGSRNRPFNSLSQAELASGPGDTIYILQSPSSQVLDGSIQLKNFQKLIGLGPKVTRANENSA